MTTYPISRGIKLRTSATRRYLIVSVMDGRAKVEASTDDDNDVGRLANRYRDLFAHNGPRCKVIVLDQGARRPLFEGIR